MRGGINIDFKELMKYQNLMQNQLARDQRVSRKIEILSIINELTAGPDNLAYISDIVKKGKSLEYTERDIKSLIDDLKIDGIIYQPSPNQVKKR